MGLHRANVAMAVCNKTLRDTVTSSSASSCQISLPLLPHPCPNFIKLNQMLLSAKTHSCPA